ncbi:MAG: hypothetical protein ABFS14_13640, partial [Gemmatimonadota bacterium]
LSLLALPATAVAQEQATAEQDPDAMVTSHADDLDPSTAEVGAKEPGINVLRRAEAAAFANSAEDMMQRAVGPDGPDAERASIDDAITIKTTTIIIGLAVLVVLLAI